MDGTKTKDKKPRKAKKEKSSDVEEEAAPLTKTVTTEAATSGVEELEVTGKLDGKEEPS